MFRTFKSFTALAAVLALSASSALAQGYRDAGAKAAGQFGTGFHAGGGWTVRSYRGPPNYYSAPAPQIVQSMPAPMVAPAAPQVAQAPTDRRSLSIEPSQPQAVPQPVRSYSYEPAAPAYSAPARRSRSTMPSYLLPATDPRKHGG
jgi:hypothetical protein